MRHSSRFPPLHWKWKMNVYVVGIVSVTKGNPNHTPPPGVHLLSSHWDSSFHSLTTGSSDPRTYKTFAERSTGPYHSRIKSNRFSGNDVHREKSPIIVVINENPFNHHHQSRFFCSCLHRKTDEGGELNIH